MVISSYLATLMLMRLVHGSTESLLRFPCNVEVAGLGVLRCAGGSQLPAEQILQKLQDQNQRVKHAATNCCEEYIASTPQASSTEQHPDPHLHLSS
ncbi:MAG TPA: hypothetical protein VN087_16135 [Verrucomicrobiae bacterium]|nr:hypothetical protein [Verrucomicrobiae bacterium]